MRGVSASIVGELLMALISSNVQASGSQSLGSRTFCRFCPPRPNVLKRIKTFFQDMNKEKMTMSRGGGGGGGVGAVHINEIVA